MPSKKRTYHKSKIQRQWERVGKESGIYFTVPGIKGKHFRIKYE